MWGTVGQLQVVRVDGPAGQAIRLREPELLLATKIADLLAPGPVLLRLGLRLRRHPVAAVAHPTDLWMG